MENGGGGGSREEVRGGRGLWQSTQGLEAKRLIPQEALHPVLIRREFYERFERYPLCKLGSRREYARCIVLPWKYWTVRKSQGTILFITWLRITDMQPVFGFTFCTFASRKNCFKVSPNSWNNRSGIKGSVLLENLC